MNNTGIARLANIQLNNTDDPVPGQSVSTGQSYGGQLGAVIVVNTEQAQKMQYSTNGTLYGGRYQYVRFYGSQSGTTIKGGPVYWQDPDNFVVTADVPSGNLGFAGVALNVPTKGNYAWILTAGKCQCQPLDNTTKGTPAAGDTMVTTATIGRFDDLADATAYDGTNLKLAVGQWIEAPADGTSVRYLAWVTGAKQIGV